MTLEGKTAKDELLARTAFTCAGIVGTILLLFGILGETGTLNMGGLGLPMIIFGGILCFPVALLVFFWLPAWGIYASWKWCMVKYQGANFEGE